MRRRNAVVVFSPERLDERDFRAIAQRVAERAPDVKVYLVTEGWRNHMARWIPRPGGPYVVVKPSAGRRGAKVILQRDRPGPLPRAGERSRGAPGPAPRRLAR